MKNALLLFVLFSTGCTRFALNPGERQPDLPSRTPSGLPVSSPDAVTRYVSCAAGEHFVVQLVDDIAWVFYPGVNRKLHRVDGETYADGGASVSMDSPIVLDTRSVRLEDCEIDYRQSVWEAAKLRGVDFRAVGNEPPWVLELTGEEANIGLNYGTETLVSRLNRRDINQSDRKTILRSSVDGEIQVRLVIEGVECHDVMSGEAFETSVELMVGESIFKGCGRALH